MAAVAAPLLAIPAPPPTTFAEYFADATNDPYDGDYAPVMRTFHDANTVLHRNTIHALVKAMGIDTPNVYIGLCMYANEEAGWSMVLHDVAPFSELFQF